MQLTDEQLNVINSNESRILVKAGAGTGKTEVLTKRIIRLIEDNPSLSIKEMAIITFTNKATEELQSRLKRSLYIKWKTEKDFDEKLRFRYELESLNSAQISTIHIFCKSILEVIGPYFDSEIQYSPLYSVKSDLLTQTIDETIEVWIKEKIKNTKKIEHLQIMPIHKLTDIVKKAYSLIRTKGLNLETIIKGTKRNALLEMNTKKKNLKLELLEIIDAVTKRHRLYKYNRLDVDDLLEYCSKILKSRPDLAQEVRRKYKYIFIDEFQDTSLYQSDLVKTICNGSKESPNLFVVGDIKQSIYEFRGADTNAYSKIEDWIKDEGVILSLSTNWRSTPEIVYFVNNVFNKIKDNEKYNFKRDPLRPREVVRNPNIYNAYDWLLAKKGESQAKLIANYLKGKIEKNEEDAGNFTILTRKNFELEIIAEQLINSNVPFQILDSGNFYNQNEIIDTYRVLYSILYPFNQLAKHEGLDTIFFHNNQQLFERIISEIRDNNLVYNLTPSQLIDLIYQKTNILNKCSSQVKSNLNKLKEVSRRLMKNEKLSLYKFVEWFSAMISANIDEPLADSVNSAYKSVKLMTIHKSKGLEFPIVILPNLNQAISRTSLNPDILVNQRTSSLEFCYRKYYDSKSVVQSSIYEESLEPIHFNVYSEELRVLYVALTRAKRKLVLCGSENIQKDKICFQNWLKED